MVTTYLLPVFAEPGNWWSGPAQQCFAFDMEQPSGFPAFACATTEWVWVWAPRCRRRRRRRQRQRRKPSLPIFVATIDVVAVPCPPPPAVMAQWVPTRVPPISLLPVYSTAARAPLPACLLSTRCGYKDVCVSAMLMLLFHSLLATDKKPWLGFLQSLQKSTSRRFFNLLLVIFRCCCQSLFFLPLYMILQDEPGRTHNPFQDALQACYFCSWRFQCPCGRRPCPAK
ncbi:hypothetical protein IWZ03DRAFT_185102 [Phyllosticta citriasiana]|uniref:Uncharacterized protein n=1 Tax=Phyllosticta citriasiana TaxID=595635 RepID=A0ABR1KNA4_9PEZI